MSYIKSVTGELLNKPLVVNLFARNNGIGLRQDLRVLSLALKNLGCSCRLYPSKVTVDDVKEADINIFIEKINPDFIKNAAKNWFIANPDWYTQEEGLLNEIDLILCRTREGERIFKTKGLPTYYLGFTSLEHYNPEVKKIAKQLFHLAGGSLQKGTQALMEIWKRRPDFPKLHLVNLRTKVPVLSNLIAHRTYLHERDLIFLQNQSGVHLCPSETEGFGYYIVEGMSAKSVIVTTNAPPMNEFITDPRCLVSYSRASPMKLATAYFVDIDDLEEKIESLLNTSEKELAELGEKNRADFLERYLGFIGRLKILLQS